jgi:uncharacterized membrane protein
MALTPFVSGTWWALIFIGIVIFTTIIFSLIYQAISGSDWEQSSGSTDPIMNILGNLSYLGSLYGISFIIPLFLIVSMIFGFINYFYREKSTTSTNARNIKTATNALRPLGF